MSGALRLPLGLAAAAGLALLLLAPESSTAHTQIGGSLGLGQRDVRVFDNFTDATANDNTTEHPSFPGFTGAELAIWKAAVEWGSALHGDGQGDPHQPGGLGSGGANFDPTWQGNAEKVEGPNGNVHSEISGGDNGVLAYCETPISDGWRIRYYAKWNWDDGPGVSVQGIDLQGVATHEYGHALGLGHSDVPGATMSPSIAGSGVGARSIEPDDVAGVRAIYGTAAPDKPRITGIAVAAGVLTVTGQSFTATENEVWFTRRAPGTGTPVKVTGLVATDGGTRIELAIPAAAGPGDVLVRRAGSGHAALSNAWPIDPAVDSESGGPPVITAVTPNPAPTVGPTQIDLDGRAFTGVYEVRVGGAPLAPNEFTVHDDAALTFTLPLLDHPGPTDVLLVNAAGEGDPTQITLVAPDPPLLLLDSTLLFSDTGATLRAGSEPGDVVFLTVSPELSPTLLPGIVSLDIGNQMQSLYVLGSHTVPAKGWVERSLPLAGLPFGLQIHFQAAVFDMASGVLPLVPSNVATGTFYF